MARRRGSNANATCRAPESHPELRQGAGPTRSRAHRRYRCSRAQTIMALRSYDVKIISTAWDAWAAEAARGTAPTPVFVLDVPNEDGEVLRLHRISGRHQPGHALGAATSALSWAPAAGG